MNMLDNIVELVFNPSGLVDKISNRRPFFREYIMIYIISFILFVSISWIIDNENISTIMLINMSVVVSLVFVPIFSFIISRVASFLGDLLDYTETYLIVGYSIFTLVFISPALLMKDIGSSVIQGIGVSIIILSLIWFVVLNTYFLYIKFNINKTKGIFVMVVSCMVTIFFAISTVYFVVFNMLFLRIGII